MNSITWRTRLPRTPFSPDRWYKSLASLVKSTPRDRRQFKCMPWMKEWWRYAKQRERGQPRRKGPKEKWIKLGWRHCAIFIYLDRFDSPRQSLAFRCKEARERITINSISINPIRSLLIVTNLYSLLRMVDYSLRGVRIKNLSLKSLAYFNKSNYTSPLVMVLDHISRTRL